MRMSAKTNRVKQLLNKPGKGLLGLFQFFLIRPPHHNVAAKHSVLDNRIGPERQIGVIVRQFTQMCSDLSFWGLYADGYRQQR